MKNSYATAEIPSPPSKYMRLSKGEKEQVFRILGEQIQGTEGWKTQDDGTRKPVRVPIDESLNVDDIDDPDEIKYFWAMPVWNYQEKIIQILEITQPSILKAIRAYARDEDYGDPTGYDLKVTRAGESKETRYQTIAKPPKPLDKEILERYKDMKINLDALYTGDDPFAESKGLTEKDIEEVAREVK